MAYIYKIVNDINDKVYVGKTEFSIEKRFQEHCKVVFYPRCEKRPLYSAMQKYGIEHFHIELIEETDHPEEREIYWIEKYNSYSNGYNATKGGDGKRYLDYDLVIATYKEIGSVRGTATKLGIDRGSVSNILHQNNITIKSIHENNAERESKAIDMYDLKNNFIKSFSSITEASKYLIKNKLTKSSNPVCVATYLGQICKTNKKIAYGFMWNFA